MDFPSLEFIESLIDTLNHNEHFERASRWSDVKVLFAFGDQKYWLKLYGGKVIDHMEYYPMANPLGWDYSISGSLETWQALRDGSLAAGYLLDTGRISVDGNLMQANRLYESTHLMIATICDLKIN
ncbi:MAG: hypothetical protein ACU84Q_10630 [Gammaproteobacteria bacterium]